MEVIESMADLNGYDGMRGYPEILICTGDSLYEVVAMNAGGDSTLRKSGAHELETIGLQYRGAGFEERAISQCHPSNPTGCIEGIVSRRFLRDKEAGTHCADASCIATLYGRRLSIPYYRTYR